MNSLLVASLLFCPAADSEPKVKLPTGAPPTMMVLQVKGDNLVCERVVQVPVQVAVKEKVKIDGKEVEQVVVKMVLKEEKITATYVLKGATFQTADGKKIDLADAKKKLASPKLVVISGDGKPVDAGYLAALKSDTLVAVVPTMGIGVPTVPGVGAPAPMPVPLPAPVPGKVVPLPPVIIKPVEKE